MAGTINVAFIGNPNCGKTTLFNAYTGANLKVANWPGVTVEKKEGHATYEGQDFGSSTFPVSTASPPTQWRRLCPGSVS